VYNKNTLPVMDFYKAQGKLSLIDGVGSIDSIFNRICSVLESK
jgi:adenylate kinase